MGAESYIPFPSYTAFLLFQTFEAGILISVASVDTCTSVSVDIY